MATPILYDMKRTLTSKSTLVLMILLVLMAFVVVSQLLPNGVGQTTTSPGTQLLSYFDSNGTYHFMAFSWNQFGQGVSGVTFSVALNYSQVAYNGRGTTSPKGDTNFTINAPVNSNYSLDLLVSTSSGQSTKGGNPQPFVINTGNGTSVTVSSGQIVDLSAGVIVPITNPNNASQIEMQVIWAAANGSVPTNYSIYYKTGNDLLLPDSLQESNMQLLGTMSNTWQAFSLPKLNSSRISNNNDSLMYFVLFSPNGSSTSQTAAFPLSQLYPPKAPPLTSTRANSILAAFFQNLFGIFIPLVAIVGAYTGYCKDRISGVIESVLSQPISRLGLSLSRFFSIFGSLAIAASVAVALVDVMVFYFTGGFASNLLLVYSTLAFFVELAVFTTIMMLLSHLVRSSAPMIGIGIGLFMVIDFFWGLIIDLVAGASATGYNTTKYGQLVIIAQFINPAQFVSLINTYLTHVATFVGVSSFSLPMTPSSYGISILSMTADAAIWIAIPLGAFLYLSTRRD